MRKSTVAIVLAVALLALAGTAFAEEPAAAAPEVVEVQTEQEEIPSVELPAEQSRELELALAVENLKKQLTEEQRAQVTDEQLKAFILQQDAKSRAEKQGRPVRRGYDHPDARVVYSFAQSPNRTFIAGEIGEITLGFSNIGAGNMLLKGIAATLYHPADASYQILNFSGLPVKVPVPAGQDASVTYMFRPDPLLAPRIYGMAVTVYYTDGVLNYSSTFFNSTIEIIEVGSIINPQTIFSFIGTSGIIFAIGYGLKGVFKGKGKKTAPKAAPVKAAGKTKPEDNEWLIGTSAIPRRK